MQSEVIFSNLILLDQLISLHVMETTGLTSCLPLVSFEKGPWRRTLLEKFNFFQLKKTQKKMQKKRQNKLTFLVI